MYFHKATATAAVAKTAAVLGILLGIRSRGWRDFLCWGGGRICGVEVVRNEIQRHDQLSLGSCIDDAVAQSRVQKEVEAGCRAQGSEHGLLQPHFLDRIQSLV